jgi:hypothetical protein
MAKKRAQLDADEGAEFFDTDYQEARTDPQADDLDFDDSVDGYNVGLRPAEWQRLDAVAAEMGITRDEAAAWALRAFLKQVEAGEILTDKKPKQRGHKMLSSEIKLIFLKAYFKVFDKPGQS